MQDSNVPTKIGTIWGASATAPYINAIPVPSQQGITSGRASFTDGFPPNCFLPLASGGAGPFGGDNNGIFQLITQWQQWSQAGGPMYYDATFATAIGGYPKGAILPSITLGGLWQSTIDNNSSNPDTGGAGWSLIFGTQSFDAASPPAGDINLAINGRLIITFEGVTSLPLKVASAAGIYRVYFGVTNSNSINSDIFFLPNNTQYTGAFSRFSIEATDLEITSFGSATSDPGTTAITGGISTYSALLPQNAVSTGLNNFLIDMFLGPSPSDSINDRGPFMAEMLVFTYTAGKLIKSTGAIIGGSHVASSLWNDTLTTWTSLGTLQVWLGSGALTNLATITGVAVIERIA